MVFDKNESEVKSIPCLLQIEWKSSYGYFLMDIGAFPNEKEVLLSDGLSFKVLEIQQLKTQSGDIYNLITLGNHQGISISTLEYDQEEYDEEEDINEDIKEML